MPAHSALEEMKKGAFKRTASAFRNWVKEGGEHPPVAGRYHLYASHACPWAARCLAVRSLLGLDGVVGVSIVHPTWARTKPEDEADKHCGWVFHEEGKVPMSSPIGNGEIPSDGCTVDHVLGKKTLREVYEHSGDTAGKYSVPVLFDKVAGVIVNNESSEIVEMFATVLARLGTNPYTGPMDLLPDHPERAAIDDRIYHGLNNGVYKSGFAQTQEAYETAVREVFATLDWLEDRLSKSRYILGDKLSITDIRAYVTLVRFDPVYVVYFKCSLKMIREYPNIYGYLRDLYQNPFIKRSTNLDHIVQHYFTSHPTLNHYAIMPLTGTNLDAPHDRAERVYAA